MTKKAIIDVDVNDEKFKSFLKDYEKYTDGLGAASEQWREMGKAMGAAILSAHRAMEKFSKEDEENKKKGLEAAKKHKTAAEGVAGAWHKAAAGTAALAMNLERATLSMVKWSAIWGTALGLLGVGGSLFGLERLALSASSSRRSATGLGLSIGEQKAFGVQYGRVVDESKLAELQDARYDYSRRGAFSAMGIFNPEQGSAAELAIRMMDRAKQLYRPGMSDQEMQTRGFGQFFSREELNRIKSSDLPGIESAYRKDVGKLGFDDDTARHWQDFNIKLRESGETIEKTLIISLGKLVENGTLLKLSDSLTHLVEALGESPKVKYWLDEFAAALERVTKWLGGGKSGAPSGGSSSYAPAIGKVYKIPDPLDFIFGKHEDKHNPGNIMVPGTHKLAAYSSDASGLGAVAYLLQRYQRRFHLDTVEGLISKYAPRTENDTEAYIKDVVKRTGFKRNQHLDLSDEDTMDKLVSAITKHEGSKAYSPTQVKLAIENKTGSNVVVNAKSASVAAQGGQ